MAKKQIGDSYTKTYKYKMHPTDEQVAYLNKCLRSSCIMYNMLLEWVIEDHYLYHKYQETPSDENKQIVITHRLATAAMCKVKENYAEVVAKIETHLTGPWYAPDAQRLGQVATFLRNNQTQSNPPDLSTPSAGSVNGVGTFLVTAIKKCLKKTDRFRKDGGRWGDSTDQCKREPQAGV